MRKPPPVLPMRFALLLVLAAATQQHASAAVDIRHLRFLDDDAPHPVLIGYKSQQGSGTVELASASAGTGDSSPTSSSSSLNDPRLSGSKALDRVSAKKGTLTRSEVQELLDSDPDILYVEEDVIRKALVEVAPIGIGTIQADNAQYPPPIANTGSGAPCSDPSSFKIGIIDSGLDVSHPDIPCFNVDDSSAANCVGQMFGVSLSGEWSAPIDIHGTFVTGIIGAVRGNDVGVTGVLNNDNVCIIMARVFDSDGQAMLSDVLEATQWVADQGANVLNLSLGGPSSSQTEEAVYQDIKNDGRLVVCASGNDGTTDMSYPASYSSTVSVGAVDSSLNRATFSQYNAEVDLVAPGVLILSTAPLGYGNLYLVRYSSSTFPAFPVALSPSPPSEISGTLVECTNLGQETCPGSGGHVCIIERGTNSFEDKALNCERGGGSAAIIYNDGDGFFQGTLASPTQVTIPVFSLDGATGASLAQNAGDTVTLLTQDGYTVADGTSFASPYAAGAAAAVWQACRSCTNDQVRSCLESTARDLGTSGRDDEYGNGLVQVDSAYLCLVQTEGCCTPGSPTASVPTSPTPAVPTQPTPSPVAAPVTGTDDVPVGNDCSALEESYQQCFANDFSTTDELDACRNCMNAALSGLGTGDMCESTSSTLCYATRSQCQCSTCTDEIESYLSCALLDPAGCPALDCGSYSPDHNNTSTGDIDLTTCSETRFQLERCMSLSTTEDGVVSPQQQDPQQESDCSACLVGSLPRSFSGSTCDEINQNFACPGIDGCSSSCSPQCQQQVTDYMDCVVDANTIGCNLGCDSSNNNGSSGGSDGGAPFDTSTASTPHWLSGLRIFVSALGALMMLIL